MTLRLGSRSRTRNAFSPVDTGAVLAWLRLQASSQSAGDWTNWADVLNVTPAAPSDPLRRPAVGASNGLPTAIFSGAAVDTLRWPLAAPNNGTTKYGFWLRVKPTVTTGTQYVMSCSIGTGGANINKMNLALTNGGVLTVDLYFSGVSRSFASSAGAVNTSTATAVGFTYDSSGALETDKFKMIVGSQYVACTPSGSGVPAALAAATGNIVLGNYQDQTGSAIPFTGVVGPNILSLGRHLTASELLSLNGFEVT